MLGHVVDGCVDWSGPEARMIEMVIVLNAIVIALAGLRVIERDGRERDLWRAYDERRMPKSSVVGPSMKGQGS
jgi:hypothetical protein